MWFRQCRMPKRLRGVAPLALRLTHFCYANVCTSVASPPLVEVGWGLPLSLGEVGWGFYFANIMFLCHKRLVFRH